MGPRSGSGSSAPPFGVYGGRLCADQHAGDCDAGARFETGALRAVRQQGSDAGRMHHRARPAVESAGDLPELRDREILAEVLTAFGTRLLTETTDPVVVAVFRLAISETVHAPKVAQALEYDRAQAHA